MLIKCDECNIEFKTTKARVAKNKYNCCSTKCAGRLNSKRYSKKVQKNCVVCNKVVFYKQSHAKQIVNHTCSRKCMGKLRKTYYSKDNNPKALKLNQTERYFWDKAKSLIYRAKQKKIPCDIDYKFLIELFNKQNGNCYYSGLPLKLKSDNKNTDYNTLSVDRLDSQKGYTKDNIVFCLNSINMLKAHHNMKDIELVFKAIYLKQQNNLNVLVKKLYRDSKLPYQKHITDTGYDLSIHRLEDCGNYIKVYTGISIQPDSGYWFMLSSRSSCYKQGLSLYNNLGIIDNSYTGEIVGIFNKTNDFKELPKVGDRILQLIPQQLIKAKFVEVEELNETERGEGGFGSTNQDKKES